MELAGVCPNDQAELAAVDDDRLALEARDDPRAFGELYVRHRLSVYRYLRARSGGDDDALDLTALTFERALAGIARYSSRGSGPRAWLLRIARNAAVDHHRRRRVFGPGPPPRTTVASERSAEEVVVAADERRRLHRSLRALPEAQRDAIALRFGGGLTAREIAVVLGKSEAATQKLVSRGLARLKEIHREVE